jgi:hypothetical protein
MQWQREEWKKDSGWREENSDFETRRSDVKIPTDTYMLTYIIQVSNRILIF